MQETALPMRALTVVLLCLLATAARSAHIESILKDLQIEATAQSFIPRVNWNGNPPLAYYQCVDGRREDVIAVLWQGPVTQITTPKSGTQSLLYGEHESIKVFAYKDDNNQPWLAAYLMLPSGETHLFRVNAEHEIVKASMQWQCRKAPYKLPPVTSEADVLSE